MLPTLLQTTSTQTGTLLGPEPCTGTRALAAPYPVSAESERRFFTTKQWLLFSSDATKNLANKRVQIHNFLDPEQFGKR